MTTNEGKPEKRKQGFVDIPLSYRQSNIDKYKNNPALIEKLNKNSEISADLKDTEDLLNDITSVNHKLELQITQFKVELKVANRSIKALQEERKLADLELSRVKTALEDLREKKNSTDIELATIKRDIVSAKELSVMQAFASTVATVLIGFGTGLITAGINYGLINESLLIIGIIFNLFPTIIAYFNAGKRK